MATAVSLHIGLSRNWTGSLLDLVSSKQDWETVMEQCTAFPYTGVLKSTSEPTDLAECDGQLPIDSMDEEGVESRLRHVATVSNSLTFNQRLRLRQFLSQLHCELYNDPVTEARLEQLPHTLFSSVLMPSLKSNNNKNPYTEYRTPSRLYNTHAFSESQLTGTVFDSRIAQSICEPRRLASFMKPRRRHCNSGSGVNFPLPDTVGLEFNGSDESPTASSENGTLNNNNINNTIPFNPPLHVRSEPYDNLADSGLYNLATVPPPSAPTNTDTLLDEDSSSDDVEGYQSPDVSSTPSKSSESRCDTLKADLAIHIGSDNDTDSGEEQLDTLSPTSSSIINTETSLEQVADLSDSGVTSSRSSTVKLNKSVSFADEVGQPLAEVVLIESNYSKISDYDDFFDDRSWPCSRKSKWPNVSSLPSQFTRSRLKNRSPLFIDDDIITRPTILSSNTKCQENSSKETLVQRSTWVPRFPQPASLYYEFRQRVEIGSVSLESVTVSQLDETFTTQLPQLSGTIKVKNLSFEKQVSVRLTTDNWNSYTDCIAMYNPQLSAGLLHSTTRFDTFTFQIHVEPPMVSQKPCNSIEFAICYTVGPDGSWGQYWDSNNGMNYVIEREISRSHWPSNTPTRSPNTSPSTTRTDFSRLPSPPAGHYAFDSLSDMSASCDNPLRPYTADYRPNFEGVTQFTDYRSWTHFAGENTYY